MDGIIVVDKPTGMTSHDVVSRVRRRLNMKRVGHAGTLDPMATGVLIILVGNATKLFEKFVGFDKAYLATLRLGLKTRSADIQGETLQEKPFAGIVREDVEVLEDARLVELGDAPDDELHGQQGLARSGPAAHQRRPPARQPAFGDVIQAADAGGTFRQ